jgi:hypothetical protein
MGSLGTKGNRSSRTLVLRGFVQFALLSALCAGCGSEKEQELRREAARVSRAVDVLRAAPNDAKPPRLAALRATECAAQDVCDVKRACMAAYEHHLAAMNGTRAATHAVGADGALTPDAARAAAELTERSEEELNKAKDLNRQCLALQGALRRKHRL